MKTALFPLQAALFERLSNDTALTAKGVHVHDYVSSEANYPFISLGEDTVNDWGTKLENGEEITHTLHVWSQYKGKKEAKEIMGMVLESLFSAPLSLGAGFSADGMRREYMNVITDIDGVTQHGVMRLRFNVSQSA